MAQVRVIDPTALAPYLRRSRRADHTHEIDLPGVLRNLLEKANQFVPSQAGTVFLDDPRSKRGERASNVLSFVACFGESAEQLLGKSLPADRGIVGHVYQTGRSYFSAAPHDDPLFNPDIDRETHYTTESILCVPLQLEAEVVGALQLINRADSRHYTRHDLELLEIFAQTISTAIANALDAQRAREIARRDDLTDLYNDRFLHQRLEEIVAEALAASHDCGVVFLDLDGFKAVNDRHGHLIGSRVLREVGHLLARILPHDALAARYGGDEFAVIYPQRDAAETVALAEEVRAAIEHFVFLERADANAPTLYPALALRSCITGSLGATTLGTLLANWTGPRTPALLRSELLRRADGAMYQAKAAGKNRVCRPLTGRP